MDKDNSTDPDVINEINNNKKRLEELYERKADGIIFRSTVNWVEGGENNTIFFADLEKRKFEKKVISQLNIGGKNITDKDEILLQEKNITTIFIRKENNYTQSDINFFPDEYSIKFINEEMNNNKSSGSDGITTEF